MRRYPVEPDTDPGFSLRLVLDVAEVLEQHGYPSMIEPAYITDFIELKEALIQFLYEPTEEDQT